MFAAGLVLTVGLPAAAYGFAFQDLCGLYCLNATAPVTGLGGDSEGLRAVLGEFQPGAEPERG